MIKAAKFQELKNLAKYKRGSVLNTKLKPPKKDKIMVLNTDIVKITELSEHSDNDD